MSPTPNPDLVLASVRALIIEIFHSTRAEQLFFLLAEVREFECAAKDPDLALALAQGWLALVTVPYAEELPQEERRAHLAFALEAAKAIAPADERDAFGARLARELLFLLPRPSAEARAVLARSLVGFPADQTTVPYLLAALADEQRACGEWRGAWSSLQEAEDILSSTRSTRFPAEIPVLERTLAGVRCQLELAWGLFDQAAATLQREREAVRTGASDPASQLDLLLNASGVALAIGKEHLLTATLEELDQRMSVLALPKPALALLRARRALMLAMLMELARGDAAAQTRARAALVTAFSDTELENVHRVSVGVRLVLDALEQGALKEAGEWLTELEERTAEQAVSELSAAVEALRVRVALARHDAPADLRARITALDEHYDDFLRSFQERPDRQGGLGYLAWSNRRLLLGTLFEAHLALDGKGGLESTVDRLLRAESLGTLARRLGCNGATVSATRAALLGPGTGLLLYLIGWECTHLVVLDGDALDHFAIPWKYDLESAPRVLFESATRSPVTWAPAERAAKLVECTQAAQELARRLLPPAVQDRIERLSSLVVVCDERLGPVVFEALPVAGIHLGVRVALSHLPSLTVGIELARRASQERVSESDCLLVAAPKEEPSIAKRYGLAPLELGQRSTQLLEPFPRGEALLGGEAQWPLVRAKLAEQSPRVLHFLVHGVSDPLRELSGGLVLTPSKADSDGVLWCEQLIAEEFESPPLVLLSACGARGTSRMGDDGMTQLASAFLARGSTAVVHAAGDLALEPTLELMRVCSRALAGGVTAAEALRKARAELAARAEYAHPFYTSSLRLTGVGTRPIPR